MFLSINQQKRKFDILTLSTNHCKQSKIGLSVTHIHTGTETDIKK